MQAKRPKHLMVPKPKDKPTETCLPTTPDQPSVALHQGPGIIRPSF